MKSMLRGNVAAELAVLDARVSALLPPRYQHCYTSVSPNSMGSAGLEYDSDGAVAWNQIWTTFCDLALAGGPPHRGKLLGPVSAAEAAADPGRYGLVLAGARSRHRAHDRFAGGQGLRTGLGRCAVRVAGRGRLAPVSGQCRERIRRRRQSVLQLPAGPGFRVEKEIKNVVVALAKSYHYWDGHLTAAQQSLAARGMLEAATPAEAAASPSEYEAAVREVEYALLVAGLPTLTRRYVGWVGVETGGEEDAVWLLRAVLVEQVLARREENVLYLAVDATAGSDSAARAARAFHRAWELWSAFRPRRPGWRPSGRSG